MAMIEIPCETCIHNKVCDAKRLFDNAKAMTHPYIKILIECTEFYAKPQNKIQKNPFNNL